MDLEQQFSSEHLFFAQRKCRSCGEVKDLIDGFYKIRSSRVDLSSSYSYECKICTIKRVTESRKKKKDKTDIPYDPVLRYGPDIYPDW
jgi:hypothetical protein